MIRRTWPRLLVQHDLTRSDDNDDDDDDDDGGEDDDDRVSYLHP